LSNISGELFSFLSLKVILKEERKKERKSSARVFVAGNHSNKKYRRPLWLLILSDQNDWFAYIVLLIKRKY